MTQISETAKEKIRSQFPVFQEAARAFYAKELAPGKYKGTSGKFGSYGERGANSSMLRLRFSGGAIDQAHMAFLAQAIDKYHVTLAHFTLELCPGIPTTIGQILFPLSSPSSVVVNSLKGI